MKLFVQRFHVVVSYCGSKIQQVFTNFKVPPLCKINYLEFELSRNNKNPFIVTWLQFLGSLMQRLSSPEKLFTGVT